MAPKARLTPSLFDKIISGSELVTGRKTDQNANLSQNEIRAFSVGDIENFSKEMLRQSIKRDLTWLLNSLSFESAQTLSNHPNVRTSVLNYGVKDFAGRSRSSKSEMDNARAIHNAIKRFEPRLKNVSVTPDVHDDASEVGKITYAIEGDLIVGRDFIPIRLHTDIDVEASVVEVRD